MTRVKKNRPEDPPDARAKLNFLIAHPAPRAMLHHNASRASLAAKAGIAGPTLRDQHTRGMLSSTVQAVLEKNSNLLSTGPSGKPGPERNSQTDSSSIIREKSSAPVRPTCASHLVLGASQNVRPPVLLRLR